MTRIEWFLDHIRYSPSPLAIHAGMRMITAQELAQTLALAYKGLGLNHLDKKA